MKNECILSSANECNGSNSLAKMLQISNKLHKREITTIISESISTSDSLNKFNKKN